MKKLNFGDSHSMVLGYILWLFGFTGAHRFYFGRPISGVLWFFTFGLFGIGWIIDAFLIPGMDDEADQRYAEGPFDYDVAWLLLAFLGVFGAHRFYMGKLFTGLVYFLTGGFFLVGYLIDFLTLNEQIDEVNRG